MNIQQTITPAEKWEQAGFTNNFIFYKVLHNEPELCQKILELLLHIKIDHITMQQEEEFSIDFDSKRIRLDVYVKDSDRVFDLEMQIKDTNELPERARYYQGLMDVDDLNSGKPYKDLKESHVIFICMADIFQKNQPVYTFYNICKEDNQICLNDGTFKHFFIVPNCAKMLKEGPEKSFFNFLLTNISNDDFTNHISDLIRNAKSKIQWRKQFMDWERYMTYSFLDGKDEGREEKAIETARKMIEYGDPQEKIIDITGISVETYQELLTENIKA